MRGKPDHDVQRDVRHRIIPAHAGQTGSASRQRPPAPDHPRACGANVCIDPRGPSAAGSSPRMRGKHLIGAGGPRGLRIIPAHAGQTDPWYTRRRCSPDHPRACGANDSLYHRLDFAHGSSPRMRGKPNGGRHIGCNDRIIPAHAGQTRSSMRRNLRQTDHPRACGANEGWWKHLARDHGSSPRMRGKHGKAEDTELTSRIIPAHAGQTRVV